MKRQWKQIPRDHVKGQWAQLYVTLKPKGEIVMSRITYQRVGEPKAFNIWFDDVNNCIGLKPATATAKDAYPVGVCTSHGARRIHAFRLLQDKNIILPQTVRFYDAEIDHDGVLVLDLRTARVSERSAAYHRKHPKPDTNSTN